MHSAYGGPGVRSHMTCEWGAKPGIEWAALDEQAIKAVDEAEMSSNDFKSFFWLTATLAFSSR